MGPFSHDHLAGRCHSIAWVLPLALQLWVVQVDVVGSEALAAHQIVQYFNSSLVVIEAENFSSSAASCRGAPWSACVWGADDNLFASDVSNVLHSRVGYLHADANASASGEMATARATVPVPFDGTYHVLVRYEAGYRFSSPFRLTAWQRGQGSATRTKVLDRIYGLRASLKVWPFWNSRAADPTNGCGPGLQAECRFSYSTTENMVWEGVEAVANLTSGIVTLELTIVCASGSSPDLINGCGSGDRWGVQAGGSSGELITERNVDVIVLTPNSSDLALRMNASSGTSSDADGLIFDTYVATQETEVFAKVTNHADVAMHLAFPRTVNRSPLWFGRTHYPTWTNTSYRDPVTKQQSFHWTLTDGCPERYPGAVAYAPNASAPALPPSALPQECVFTEVPPGATTDWIDVGRMMDTLDHSNWNLPLGNYSIQIGVKVADADSSTHVKALPTIYDGNPARETCSSPTSCAKAGAATSVLIDASTRATQRTRDISSDFWKIYSNLTVADAAHGRPPKHVLVVAATFPREGPRSIGSKGVPGVDPKWNHAVLDFERMHGLTSTALPMPRNCTTDEQRSVNCTTDFGQAGAKTYADLELLAAGNAGVSLNGLSADKTKFFINLGDEISLGGPEQLYGPPSTNQSALNHAFEYWLEAQHIPPETAGCAPYVGCVYNTSLLSVAEGSAAQAASFYYSKRFAHDFGIFNSSYMNKPPSYHNITSTLRAFQNATGQLQGGLTCANFPPSTGYTDERYNLSRTKSYLPETFMWVRAIREGAFLLPFTEDYIFQIAAGSQQMFDLVIDVERAAVRQKPSNRNDGRVNPKKVAHAKLRALPETADVPGRPIMQYTMVHDPGNTVKSHRRRFYGGLAHGNKWTNLFEYQTFATGAGDFCDGYGGDGVPNGMYPAVHAELNELGLFDDIIAAGVPQAQGAKAAILFSETADIYYDSYGTPGADKRALYIALRHAQIALDVVTEDDVLDGTLDEYAVLYATEGHVTQVCGEALVGWVRNGGTLFATGGLALLNETNQTNTALASLYGIEEHHVFGREVGPGTEEISYIKQDLAYAKVLDTVSMAAAGNSEQMLVVGEKAMLKLSATTTGRGGSVVDTLATFSDGSPALYTKQHGEGAVFIAAFPVGLAYFRPAIPIRPAARGNTDQTFNHWLPTNFSVAARVVAALPVAAVVGAVPILSSNPLIDIGIVAAKEKGTVIVVTNWAPQQAQGLNLTVQFALHGSNVSLATGGRVTESKSPEGWRSFVFDLDVADALIVRTQ